MPTPIGQRNMRVQLLQPVVVNGIQTWNTPASIVNTIWALLDSTGGAESPQGQGPPGELTTTVTIPFLAATPRPRMRLAVVGSTRVLEITAAIDTQSQHIEWMLTCKEVAS
jgi:Phage head-tail joining protein